MNVIEIEHFTKIYKRSIVAVDDLTMNIREGSFFGFIGPNGAGKTTTVNYLSGLLKKTKGELYLFSEFIREHSYEYKRKIGFVLEIPLYFEKLTGEEYLQFVGQMYGMGKRIVISRTKELFEFLELSEKKNYLIDTYSAGMKKKISLAAGMIHDPELLILDEPFKGIDPVSSKIIRDNLKLMVKKGKTIFMTSHILEIVERLCDEFAIIDKGKLIFQGSTESIRKKFEDYKDSKSSGLEDLFRHLVTPDNDKHILSWLE